MVTLMEDVKSIIINGSDGGCRGSAMVDRDMNEKVWAYFSLEHWHVV